MRELLAAAFVFTFVIASDVGLNLPCNREMDGLLAADPDGNPSAFLSCQSNGAGSTGYWERRVCPDEMVFDFINQRCQQRKHRKQPMLNIAILNNSCAHGETCIGGTVCDLERLRCLCPYGTVPQLETLSCIKPHSSYGGFGNFEKSPSTPAGFLPNPSQTNPPPFTFNFNPLFGKETYPNYGNQNSNNKYGNANGASGNEFSSLPSGNNKYGANGQWNGAASGSGNNAGGYNGVNSFSELLPKPGVESQPFVFKPNFFASTSAPVPTKKVPTLARPGQSCRDNEMCIGGSLCTLPIALCLCPGELEEKDGECVLPASATIQIEKVGIGALCSDLAECDHGSTCVMGRCACVAPLIQHEGRCVLRQERKEVAAPAPTYTPPTAPAPQLPQLPATQLPPQPQPVFLPSTTPAPVFVPSTTQLPQQPMQPSPFGGHYGQSQNVYQEKPVTAPIYPAQPSHVTYSNYQSTMPPPTVRPTSKPNLMKISLGGSKQSGVGVPCSLNTDCMIGAYCNGNTNPPSCQCLSTHVNIEGRCERESEPVTSPPGGACTDSRICVGGSVCREGWCICPDPTMIVQRGICIQPGPRPTLPPSTASINSQVHQPYLPRTAYQNVPGAGMAAVNQYNIQQGRKIPPGASCGPLDTCVGGAMCVDGMCVCPSGMQASAQGRCEKASTPATSTAMILNPGTPTYARPGQRCANGETCVGGSVCNEMMMCACPPEKPILQGDACVAQQYRKIATPGESCDENTECTKESSCHGGQCRCQYGYIAVSGQCVALPMPTTPAMKNVVLARPLDSCDNGEQCEGGSSCDQETGVCMCPPGYIVYGVQCQPPPQSTAMQPAATPIPQAAPTFAVSMNTECADDTNCGANKVCVVGRCKCRPGFVDHDGVCEPLEKIELGERPVPVSYAKHKVETLSSERIVDQAEFTDSTTVPILPSPRTPSRQETQRPRIVGPPIRRPKPKSKGGSSTGTTTGSYKTSTGSGACPPGNEPTRDDDGRLILCNGLEPNCPPRSYCYITSGGFATEEYNCCKSW